MATVTTIQLLYELRQICNRSPLVSHVEERVMDADVLSARVHLTITDTFISVFYNVATAKTSFALVEKNQRIYGVDNAIVIQKKILNRGAQTQRVSETLWVLDPKSLSEKL